MDFEIGGISSNELMIGAAVLGGAYLLYSFKGASDQQAAASDSDGCPSSFSVSAAAGAVTEPWAMIPCAINKIGDMDVAQIASDAAGWISNTAETVKEDIGSAFGFPTPFTPNTAVETMAKTNDFQTWIDYATGLRKSNPAVNITVDGFGCMDTMWLPPLPGAPAAAGKVCNDNSGCYAESFYKDGSTTAFGSMLKAGIVTCAVVADGGVLAELDYNAVKANPLAIPLPSDQPQSLQQAGFGVSFENAANLLNKSFKLGPPSKYQTSAVVTVNNLNSIFHSNPMDNPSMPVPPGGWK